ncbi:hypothetical protein [Persicobacter psychrovividus]|uniref:Lipoprotein n=1 Tax=Persicobacter psychrovividus TaxID=387638 RepID=A0ABN6L807_9BACT|nr:hypothetical protein PEPS_00580 [Persicobacter psychrovividus]
MKVLKQLFYWFSAFMLILSLSGLSSCAQQKYKSYGKTKTIKERGKGNTKYKTIY